MNTLEYSIINSFMKYGLKIGNTYHAFLMTMDVNDADQSVIIFDSNKKIIFEYDFLSDTLFIDNKQSLLSIVEIIDADLLNGECYV